MHFMDKPCNDANVAAATWKLIDAIKQLASSAADVADLRNTNDMFIVRREDMPSAYIQYLMQRGCYTRAEYEFIGTIVAAKHLRRLPFNDVLGKAWRDMETAWMHREYDDEPRDAVHDADRFTPSSFAPQSGFNFVGKFVYYARYLQRQPHNTHTHALMYAIQAFAVHAARFASLPDPTPVFLTQP